jgi:hypothetical protein
MLQHRGGEVDGQTFRDWWGFTPDSPAFKHTTTFKHTAAVAMSINWLRWYCLGCWCHAFAAFLIQVDQRIHDQQWNFVAQRRYNGSATSDWTWLAWRFNEAIRAHW